MSATKGVVGAIPLIHNYGFHYLLFFHPLTRLLMSIAF